MKRRFFILLKWIFLLAYVLGAMSFVYKSNNNILCSSLIVYIDKKHKFVNEELIKNTLVQNGIIIDSLSYINNIDIKKIEEVLENNQSIKKADVYTSLDGKVYISVQQKNPIMRIITKDNNSFYIDDNCCYMPLSDSFTSDVIVVNGNLNFDKMFYKDNENNILKPQKKILDLYDFINYINKDELWRSQIEQIYLNNDNDYELIPRVGNNIVILGSLENYKYKLWKLKAFYKKGSSMVDIDNYSFINLKYTDKVICKKR